MTNCFEWEENDDEYLRWTYTECITKVKMGPFAIGTSVQRIVLDLDLATIEVTGFEDHDGTTLKWKGSLSVNVV